MKRILILALCLLLAGILVAHALPGDKMDQRKMVRHHEFEYDKSEHHPRLMRVFEEMELSENQLSQLEEKKISWEKTSIDNKAEIEVKEIDARIAAKNFEFDKLKKITSEIFDLKKAHKLSGIDHLKECWNILDKDQQKEAKELLENPIKRRWKDDEDDEEKKEFDERYRRRSWRN